MVGDCALTKQSAFTALTSVFVHWSTSFSGSDGLDRTRAPGLVEPGFKRTVESKAEEPGLAGNRLDPVRLVPLRGLRAEPDRRGSVGIGHKVGVAFIVLAGVRLIRLKHGTGLRVVDHEGPEVLCRNIRRQGH